MLVVTNDKNLVNIGLVELPPLVNALPQAHDEIGAGILAGSYLCSRKKDKEWYSMGTL
jgi:hypothetical protein